MKQKTVITKSGEETRKFAEELVRRWPLREGAILALYGELGSGKTTFVQGLAKGLGIKRRIISPTFVLIRHYPLYPTLRLRSGREPYTLYHIDLYRTEGEKDIEGLGLEEILNDKRAIIAIEWADRMKKLLPKRRWDIYFRYTDEGKREITIKEHE